MKQNDQIEKKKIGVIAVAPYGELLKRTIEKLARVPELRVLECSDAFEARTFGKSFSRCMVIFHADDLRQMVKHVDLLKFIKERTDEGRARAVLTTPISATPFLTRLAQTGCDVVNEPIKLRALLFKIQRHLRYLAQLGEEVRPSPSSIQFVANRTGGRGFDGGSNDLSDDSLGVRFTDALTADSDCWLLTETPPRMVGKKWVVHLAGPPPYLGRWVAHETTNQWLWKPYDDLYPRGPLAFGGLWIFRGQKPGFRNQGWWFIGPKPELSFFEKNRFQGSKLSVEAPGRLVIAKDSEKAKSNLAAAPPPRFGVEGAPEELEIEDDPDFEFDLAIDRPIAKKSNYPEPEAEVSLDLARPTRKKGDRDGEKGRWVKEDAPIRHVLPPASLQPVLNPLSLGLFTAEMMARSGISSKEMIQRFCHLISASFAEVRTELWILKENTWICGNTGDGGAGEYQASLDQTAVFPWLTEQGLLISPILAQIRQDEEVVGALALGGAGAKAIPLDTVQAFSIMAKGLILSLF